MNKGRLSTHVDRNRQTLPVILVLRVLSVCGSCEIVLRPTTPQRNIKRTTSTIVVGRLDIRRTAQCVLPSSLVLTLAIFCLQACVRHLHEEAKGNSLSSWIKKAIFFLFFYYFSFFSFFSFLLWVFVCVPVLVLVLRCCYYSLHPLIWFDGYSGGVCVVVYCSQQ